MDQIVFHHDSVLSDVHLLLPNTSHLMKRLNRVGQPVFISKFKILSEEERADDSPDKPIGGQDEPTKTVEGKDEEEGEKQRAELLLDEDGDFELSRRPRKNAGEGSGRDAVCPVILKQSRHGDGDEEEESTDDEDQCFKNMIVIEHTMATPLEDVGKQVWRGSCLMADFILSNPLLFEGATVLELGAGMGLVSIVMATLAKTVYCTDVGEDLLSMCRRNVTLNQHLTGPEGGDVRVRQLDWLQSDFCTDPEVEFSWTNEEVADVHDHTRIIIASDVCYDDDLTDGLFRTLYRLCSNFAHNCTIFISLEKRMNFTLRHMDVCCEAYNHFSRCMSQLQEMEDGQRCYTIEQLPVDFSQFLQYERIELLELWKVMATRLPLE